MATIAATNMVGGGKKSVTETTLTGSDTYTYNESRNPILILRNPTAGALTPVIDGDGGTTVSTNNLGVIDVSGGYSVGSIPAGESRAMALNTIKAYHRGNVVITGGTGLVAQLLEF